MPTVSACANANWKALALVAAGLLTGTWLAAQTPAALTSATHAASQPASAAPAAPVAPAAPSGTTTPASVAPDYRLGPDDVIDIEVWGEPNISGKVPVRPDGRISVPLVGELEAAGRTPLQLQAAITTRLSATIDHPDVTVVVEQVNSRKINVLGQVLRPGTYPMATDMNVLDALAMAGGPVPFAHLTRMYVLRSQNGKTQRFPFDYKKVISGRAQSENLTLIPGDTIVVP